MRSFSKTKTFQTKLSRQVPRPGTSFLDFPMGGKDVTPAGKLVILLDIASAPTKPEDGAPQHGTMAAAAARHGVSSTFVRLLWKRHGQHARDAHVFCSFKSRYSRKYFLDLVRLHGAGDALCRRQPIFYPAFKKGAAQTRGGHSSDVI